MTYIYQKHLEKQQGAVLIVSLLLLLVTTMLGITSMSTAVMEEKMVSNDRQKQLAFQAAESGLRFAETWLTANITGITSFINTFNAVTNPSELYWDIQPDNDIVEKPVNFDIYNPGLWTNGNSAQTTQTLYGSQPSPRYIIEFMGRDSQPEVNEEDSSAGRFAFRITSMGTGTDQTTTQVLQSTFRMPLF